MILRHDVANYRSILDRAQFSIIAVDEDCSATRGFDRLSRVIGIYGPNALGKSNLVEVITWRSHAIGGSLWGCDEFIPRDPHRFGDGPNQASTRLRTRERRVESPQPTQFALARCLSPIVGMVRSSRPRRERLQCPSCSLSRRGLLLVGAKGWTTRTSASQDGHFLQYRSRSSATSSLTVSGYVATSMGYCPRSLDKIHRRFTSSGHGSEQARHTLSFTLPTGQTLEHQASVVSTPYIASSLKRHEHSWTCTARSQEGSTSRT